MHKLAQQGWYLDPSTFRQLTPDVSQAPAIQPPRFTAQLLSDAFAQKWKHVWDEGQDLTTTEGYFQPRSLAQAGYGAFINSTSFTIILQVTRDAHHQVNVEGIMSILNRLPPGRPACVLSTLPPHPTDLSQQFKYQSWTMRQSIGTRAVERKGQQVQEAVFKRSVATSAALPALVKQVEQWCVPFPVIQDSTASSSSTFSGGSSSTSRQGRRSSSTGKEAG